MASDDARSDLLRRYNEAFPDAQLARLGDGLHVIPMIRSAIEQRQPLDSTSRQMVEQDTPDGAFG